MPGPPLGAVGLVVSPDGRLLAVGGKTMQIWNLVSRQSMRELAGHADVVTFPVFSPDGRRLAAISRGIVSVWDVATGVELVRFGQFELLNMGAVAFHPDGGLLAASSGTNEVKMFDTATGRQRLHLSMQSRPSVLAFSPDGRILVAGSRTPLRVVQRTGEAMIAAIEPVPGQSGSLTAWDVETGRLLYQVSAGDWVSALAFRNGGEFFVAAVGQLRQLGTVKLFHTASGQIIGTLSERVEAESSAAFSPDLAWIAAPGNGEIQLWTLADAAEGR